MIETQETTEDVPVSIRWERGSEEYILISDFGDYVVVGTYKWSETFREYLMTSETEVGGFSPPLSPIFLRMAVN